LYPGWFSGARVLRWPGFPHAAFTPRQVVAGEFHHKLGPAGPLFLWTGLQRAPRTSNASIILKLQGLPANKRSSGRPYHCWLPSPPLICPVGRAEDGALVRTMNDSLQRASGAPQPAPRLEQATPRESRALNRLPFYALMLTLLAALSTGAGYLVARLEIPTARWLHLSTALASAPIQPPALVPASEPRAASADLDSISHLAPQQQAERLLELAVRRPDQSLGLIHKNLDSWRGHLEDTDQLFHLVLAALDSNDPRVRVAAVEIDLVANNLMKSPQSLAKLLNQVHNDPDGRYLALWRLGALGNRGVEPATVLATLLRYSHDTNQRTRFWAVEGLAMLGTAESIDPLLSILAHDPAKQVRERAASCLARAGMLTGEQRLTAVPQLLNLLDDDSLEPETRDLVFASLTTITGASFGRNASAWRDWWAHHDQPEKRVHVPKGLLLA